MIKENKYSNLNLNISIFAMMFYPLLSMYITNPLVNIPRGALISQILFLVLPVLSVLVLYFVKNDELFYPLKELRGRYILVFVLITAISHMFLYEYTSISREVLIDFVLSSGSIGLIMANLKHPKQFLDWLYKVRWIVYILLYVYVILGFVLFQKHYSLQGQTLSFVTTFLLFFTMSYTLSFNRKKTFINFVDPLLLVIISVVMASRISLFIAFVLYVLYLLILMSDDIKQFTQKYKKISLGIGVGLAALVVSFILFFREIFTFINTELNKRGIFVRIFRLAATGEIFNTSGRNDIIYPAATKLIEENPLLGHGIGKVRYETKQNYVKMLGYNEERAATISDSSLYPHNFLLELVSVYGILLTAVLLFYFIKLVVKSYKTDIKYFVVFFVIGYALMLSFVSSIFTFKYLWFFIGLMCNYANNKVFK